MTFNETTFILSTPDVVSAPPDEGSEVAFVGRSNAGKSSLINALCARKALAATSKTPGRTRHLVFFATDEMGHRRLVDLPGYGFARAGKSEQKQWHHTVMAYLGSRRSLRGLVLISDIRHPLRENDWLVLEMAGRLRLPVHIAFSKKDKLTNQAYAHQKRWIEGQLKNCRGVDFSMVSSIKREGVSTVASWIESRLL